MKPIRFNFTHPVKGTAMLTPTDCKATSCVSLKVESKKDNLLEVPVDDCKEGKWRLKLNWEYDGRLFSHEEDFEIKIPHSL